MAACNSSLVSERLKRFAQRLKLARAAELALSGRLIEAETLLCGQSRIPHHAEDLDLLARILVQQNRLAEAEQRWTEAMAKAEDGEPFRRCIAALRQYGRRKLRNERVIYFGMLAVTLLLLAATLMFILNQG